MTREQLKKLQKEGIIYIKPTIIVNVLPSATDPTQDIPISRLQMAANGLPINVRCNKVYFTNEGVESLCATDRRNMDKFDVYGELQGIERNINKKNKN